MKTLFRLFGVLSVIIFLVSCGDASSPPEETAQAEPPKKEKPKPPPPPKEVFGIVNESEGETKRLVNDFIKKSKIWQLYASEVTKKKEKLSLKINSERKTYPRGKNTMVIVRGAFNPGYVNSTAVLLNKGNNQLIYSKTVKFGLPSQVTARKGGHQKVAFRTAENWAIQTLLEICALEQLLQLPNPPYNDITPLLSNKMWDVRAACCIALGDKGRAAAPYAEKIIPLLKDKKKEVRDAAEKALVKIGEGSVAVLRKGLMDSSADTKIACCNVLAGMKTKALPALGDLIKLVEKDRNYKVKIAVANAIGEMGKNAKSAAKPLGKILISSAKDQTKAAASAALRKMESDSIAALPYMLKAISNYAYRRRSRSNSDYRVDCIYAIMKSGSTARKKATPYIAKGLWSIPSGYSSRGYSSEYQTTCYKALKALGYKATPYVMPALKAPSTFITTKAEKLLVGYGKKALPTLEKELKKVTPTQKNRRPVRTKAAKENRLYISNLNKVIKQIKGK